MKILIYLLFVNHCSITCDMPARRPARKPGLIQRMVDDRLRYIFFKKSVKTWAGELSQLYWVGDIFHFFKKMSSHRFCAKYRNWTEEDWSRCLFSDESTFRVLPPMGARWVRRVRGESRFLSKYLGKRLRVTEGVAVWGCFSQRGGKGNLFFLDAKETLRQDRYLQILESEVLPTMAAHGSESYLQDKVS